MFSDFAGKNRVLRAEVAKADSAASSGLSLSELFPSLTLCRRPFLILKVPAYITWPYQVNDLRSTIGNDQ